MFNEEPEHGYIRRLIPTEEFMEYYSSLPSKTQEKFDYVLSVMANVYNIPTKFVKHLENTDLYEMRISVGTNEHRTIIFAVDNRNIVESGVIILLNSFLKKSTKDYKRQIARALAILNKFSYEED